MSVHSPSMSDGTNNEGKPWWYSPVVQEHFFHPKNVLESEDDYNADGEGFVGAPACGDMMKMWIKVDPKTDTIAECKWRTFGCASAIASTSALSVMVTENGGMKLDDALNLKSHDIVTYLGGLPDRKIHCSVLGDKALRSCICDYFKKSAQEDRLPEEKQVKTICACLQVTDEDIEEEVLEGARTLEDIQKHTKAGTGCGTCHGEIQKVIDKTVEKYFSKGCGGCNTT